MPLRRSAAFCCAACNRSAGCNERKWPLPEQFPEGSSHVCKSFERPHFSCLLLQRARKRQKWTPEEDELLTDWVEKRGLGTCDWAGFTRQYKGQLAPHRTAVRATHPCTPGIYSTIGRTLRSCPHRILSPAKAWSRQGFHREEGGCLGGCASERHTLAMFTTVYKTSEPVRVPTMQLECGRWMRRTGGATS